MTVASPPWLLVTLAALAGLFVFWRAADARRRAALARFASPQLLGDLAAGLSQRRRGVKRALVAAGVALAGIALSGPQYGFTWEETQRRGIDVLIALDTSRSMLAQDVAPSRLERAKLAVRDLVDRLGGDRVGLIAFAGSAFLQCPLTLDHGAFLEALDALEPGVIPAPGSDLASALRTADEALRSEARNVKLLVLFSDGEDLGGGAIAAAEHAAAQGIRVFTVGVGSDAGELIPVPGPGGKTEFLKDPDGQFVKSRLDAATLRRVAEVTGGFYEPLGRQGEAITAIYERALAPLPKEELASRMRRVPLDRFQWPLALAILCLVLEPLLHERRSRRTATASLSLLVLALYGLVATSTARAASPREAERLYDAGDYGQALAEYRAALEASGADPALSFNLGAAAYRAGAYADAASAFAGAITSEDPRLQEQGFYNLGNAQFRLGQKSAESNPQQAMQAWQQSLDAYEQALALAPQDEDARFNRDFVKRALEELQKQQQQQPSDDQKQDQQEQQDEPQNDQQQAGGEPNEQPSDEQQEQQQAKQDEPQTQHSPGGQQDQRQQNQQPPQPEKPDEQQAKSGADEQKPPPKDEQQPSQGGGEQPSGDGEQQQSAAQQAPGQMSPREARDLLDSLKDGEATLQELEAGQEQQQRARARVGAERDW